MTRKVCWICWRVASPTLKGVVRHMAAVHAHDPAFHVVCGIAGCARSFTNFYSFKKHLYRKHRDYLDISGTTENISDTAQSASQDDEFDFADFLECSEYEEHDTSEFQHMKQMALFLLKAKEIRKVSQSALDGLLSDFTDIVAKTVAVLKSNVSVCLNKKGLDIASFDGLEEAFSDLKITDPFHHLSCRFQQEKFYKEFLNLLVCV